MHRAVVSIAFLACGLVSCGDGPTPTYLRLSGLAPSLPATPGPVVLVSFWATWCPPCREETADLTALAASSPGRLKVMTVSQDSDMETVERFLDGPPDAGLNLVLDADRTLAEAFGVRALPVSILVVDGRLVARFEGARDWNAGNMRRLLERLIADAKQRTPTSRGLTPIWAVARA